MLLADRMKRLHRLARLHIHCRNLSLLGDLMSAGDAEACEFLHDGFLVLLVKVDVAADGLIHFRLATRGLRHDHILVGLLLLLQDRRGRVQEGPAILTAQEGKGVPDTARLWSLDRHFYNY